MSVFQYRAVKPDGSIAEGHIEAGGRQEVFRQLDGLGFNPVEITEQAQVQTEQKRRFRLGWKSKKVSFSALENFTRQLSSLLSAGVALSRALRIVCREASSPAAREKWDEIHDLVIDGSSLADAMTQSPETFPRVYVAMVHAGETGGFLDAVLAQIADFQSREKELKSKVLSALIYPMVLMVLATSVLIYLLVFFIPRFQVIFAGFGAPLPWLTRFIVFLSKAVTRYGAFGVIAIGIGVYLIYRWLQTEQGRRTWQQVLLKIPVIGRLTAQFAMARFCRMLGTLVGAGVPLIAALRVARESIGNQTLTDAVTDSIEHVQQGDGLAASLSNCPQLFPASVLEMISVAEETGRLDEELIRLATFTEKDLDRHLRTAVALVEPLMLFVMAGLIGTMFVGMVVPIFTIQQYIK
jgi:type II secretory pathway component PulF